MTKAATKVYETDAVIFPIKEFESDVQGKVLVSNAESGTINDEKTRRENNETRFARLKKNLRKKSVSIL